jgi:hypothetical protein
VILKSRTLSRTSDAIETQNLCVISHLFFNLFNLFWHTDKNFCFYAEVNFWDFARNDNSNKGTTARLNETRFGPKNKSSPIYLGPKKSRHFLMHWMSVKLPDNFQMREHSWPCRFHIKIKQYVHFTTLKRFQIIYELKRALYGIKCVLRIFLTNMAEHIVEEKKILRFVNTGFRVTH